LTEYIQRFPQVCASIERIKVPSSNPAAPTL
jgi:hypothetical protein